MATAREIMKQQKLGLNMINLINCELYLLEFAVNSVYYVFYDQTVEVLMHIYLILFGVILLYIFLLLTLTRQGK